MKQRFDVRVVWGLRLIALTIPLALSYFSYKRGGYRGLVGTLFSVVLGVLLSYPNRQGRKLAIENMRKHGLEPDRDEAPPSV